MNAAFKEEVEEKEDKDEEKGKERSDTLRAIKETVTST